MTFSYFGHEMERYDHLYNLTHLNERSVELAVALDFMADTLGSTNVLEVGNVLAHYEIGGHVVVDRYEPPTRLQTLLDWPYYQVDVFDIATQVGSSWDAIVSISTLEHIGYDHMDPSSDHDLDASLRAVRYLQTLLAPAGRMLVTLPTGYHPVLDDLIANELMGAIRSATFVRQDDEWVQTDEPVVLPYRSWADSVWIGEFGR